MTSLRLRKSWEAAFSAAFVFWLLLYSASWCQSDNYYDDSYDKQQPYDGAKVEEDKSKKPQHDKYRRNNEKQIK